MHKTECFESPVKFIGLMEHAEVFIGHLFKNLQLVSLSKKEN